MAHPAHTIRHVDRAHLQLVDAGRGWVAYRNDTHVAVHRHMVITGPLTEAWVISTQAMDAIARRILPGARLVSSIDYGVTAVDATRRLYGLPHHAQPV